LRQTRSGNVAKREGEDRVQDESEVIDEESTFEKVDVAEEGVTDEKKRARKRQKLDHDDHDITTVVLEEHLPIPEEDLLQVPPPSLPSFPLPVLPNLPSQFDLARQGLDRGLAHAELVQATTVLPINNENDHDPETRLSLRMRKRLKELGIIELFAGRSFSAFGWRCCVSIIYPVQFALIPFLLHEDPSRNAFYLPYDPPRDVCVSAPTGSGKTLAYALPIVEVCLHHPFLCVCKIYPQQILSTRIVTRLRALIVLPTRDLVMQVQETFEAIGKGRGLKVSLHFSWKFSYSL
jgi:ATP-dependent RNA helicase DDX51/DBP6